MKENIYVKNLTKEEKDKLMDLLNKYKFAKEKLASAKTEMNKKTRAISDNVELNPEEKVSQKWKVFGDFLTTQKKLHVEDKLVSFLKYAEKRVKEDVNIIETFGIDNETCCTLYVKSSAEDEKNKNLLLKCGFNEENLSYSDKFLIRSLKKSSYEAQTNEKDLGK